MMASNIANINEVVIVEWISMYVDCSVECRCSSISLSKKAECTQDICLGSHSDVIYRVQTAS